MFRFGVVVGGRPAAAVLDQTSAFFSLRNRAADRGLNTFLMAEIARHALTGPELPLLQLVNQADARSCLLFD